MIRNKLYVMRNGKLVEVGAPSESQKEPVAPYVQDDTLKQPLRFLGGTQEDKEGFIQPEFYDSKSAYLRRVKEEGLSVVGNDLLSRVPRHVRDTFTEEKILDKLQKAEAIYSDPAKYRERQNENRERLDRRNKLLGDRLGGR